MTLSAPHARTAKNPCAPQTAKYALAERGPAPGGLQPANLSWPADSFFVQTLTDTAKVGPSPISDLGGAAHLFRGCS